MIYLLIIFIILLILLILLFLPVKFKIDYIFNNGISKLDISTSYLFGLLKPEMDPFKMDKPKRVKKFKLFNRDLGYRELIDYIWDKSIIEEIVWNTEIGFTDAYLVSIIYGVLWTFKSIIMGYILSKKEIESADFNIIPIFNDNQCKIQFNCIIKIRMVYIMNIWIRILKLDKGGEKIDRTSNRRVNENYNE